MKWYQGKVSCQTNCLPLLLVQLAILICEQLSVCMSKCLLVRVCAHPLCTCRESCKWSSWACVCVCDFCVARSIIHNTAGQFESLKGTLCCERAEKLCLCQALTWTALQSTPLRAAILERLAWAEIAVRWKEICDQFQPRQPLKKSVCVWGGIIAKLEIHSVSLSALYLRSPEMRACYMMS